MTDYLVELARKAEHRVKRGYYEKGPKVARLHQSFVETIKECRNTPIITEIKYASPSSGTIREFESPVRLAKRMLTGGACGLSILTDPEGFSGELEILAKIAGQVDAPILMKDIVVSPRQLEAGANAGADAVVLIAEIFTRRLAETQIDQMILKAHELGLEVLAEANGRAEFESLRERGPDIYGINNRDLSTFKLELSTTERILRQTKELDRPVVSESGIDSPSDIRRLKAAGADAFLVGTSIMRASDVEGKVRELVSA